MECCVGFTSATSQSFILSLVSLQITTQMSLQALRFIFLISKWKMNPLFFSAVSSVVCCLATLERMPRLPCDFSIVDAFLEFINAGRHCILLELRCDGKEFTTFLL